MIHVLLNFARGFAMGAADIIPGVSGGTIALVLGIYERLIASVRAGSSAIGHLIRGDVPGFRRWMGVVEWGLLIPLGVGILSAVFALATLLERLLRDEPVIMAALFLGLVGGSVVVAWRLLRAPALRHVWIAAFVAVIVFVLLGLRGGTTEESVAQAIDPSLWAFFFAGAIAICAMILPGISGSFLLVVLGMYAPLLAAVTDRDIAALAVFTMGAVIGLALFSQLLDRALRTHHDTVISSLIGLMAGSIRILWPWPLGVDSAGLGAPDSDVVAAVVAAIVGFVAVVVIARTAQDIAASEPVPAEPD